jgi:hypothetical protein
MTEIAPTSFDYGQLDGATWKIVQDATNEIRRLGQQTAENVIAIGRQLTEVKARLDHGQFGQWLAAEFAWSERTAQRFMQAHEVFERNPSPVSGLIRYLDPTAIYDLSAPSTPEDARTEVLTKVEQGEKVTPKAVKAIVQRHKPSRTASRRERELRHRLGNKRAEQFIQAHPEAVARKLEGPMVKAIRAALDILERMAQVAHAAEAGNVDVLRLIIRDANEITAICGRIDWLARQYELPDGRQMDAITPVVDAKVTEAETAAGNGTDTETPSADVIRDRLKGSGLSGSEIARRSGVSQPVVSRFLAGRTPGAENLAKLAAL